MKTAKVGDILLYKYSHNLGFLIYKIIEVSDYEFTVQVIMDTDLRYLKLKCGRCLSFPRTHDYLAKAVPYTKLYRLIYE